ncbi:MAG: FadR/GntR family transcriptional regulator [Chloroflexi bacterium]|nr:FadR/GntR family transcriptional regulator [Chloroflexota bacterium]
MTKLFNSVKRATVAETIVEQVKDLIIDGQLTAGQKLPSERELAEELKVGRSSVREATSALVALGVAQVRQGEGVFIRSDFPDSVIDSIDWSALMLRGQIEDLIETRLVVELAIVRLATERAAQSTRRELLQMANEMRVSLDIETFIARDLEFHLALAKASQNLVMYKVIQGVQQLMRKSMSQVLRRQDMRQIAVEQHRVIATAIGQGDVDKAVATMEEHLLKDVRFYSEREGA